MSYDHREKQRSAKLDVGTKGKVARLTQRKWRSE